MHAQTSTDVMLLLSTKLEDSFFFILSVCLNKFVIHKVSTFSFFFLAIFQIRASGQVLFIVFVDLDLNAVR